MSGHSKWATIKHKKLLPTAKRGKQFTKIIKEITIAARSAVTLRNPRLRTHHRRESGQHAGDNIKRAIMRGTGNSKRPDR